MTCGTTKASLAKHAKDAKEIFNRLLKKSKC
jgi:hypothetical protein